jgi:hypothetical protein
MSVAVGQCETAQSVRIIGGENLRDRAGALLLGNAGSIY